MLRAHAGPNGAFLICNPLTPEAALSDTYEDAEPDETVFVSGIGNLSLRAAMRRYLGARNDGIPISLFRDAGQEAERVRCGRRPECRAPGLVGELSGTPVPGRSCAR